MERSIDVSNGRTLGEEEILFHEGRTKMKKKANMIIAAFKQSIWQARARLFYGQINKSQLKVDMERLLTSKCKV
jgi:hypothetical protein